MGNPEKQDEDKQNKNTSQYVSETMATIRKQTQMT